MTFPGFYGTTTTGLIIFVVMMLLSGGQASAKETYYWESVPEGYVMSVTRPDGLIEAFLGDKKLKARLEGSTQPTQAIRSAFGRWIEIPDQRQHLVVKHPSKGEWRYPGGEEGKLIAYAIFKIESEEMLEGFLPFIVND